MKALIADDEPDPIGQVSISGPLDHSRFGEDGARVIAAELASRGVRADLVLDEGGGRYAHVGELGAVISELKRFGKARMGSVVVRDRRSRDMGPETSRPADVEAGS